MNDIDTRNIDEDIKYLKEKSILTTSIIDDFINIDEQRNREINDIYDILRAKRKREIILWVIVIINSIITITSLLLH